MVPREQYEDFMDEWDFEPDNSGAGLMSAILMGIALVILIASFVWFVIRLDPLTDDFIGGEPPPTATEPAGGE